MNVATTTQSAHRRAVLAVPFAHLSTAIISAFAAAYTPDRAFAQSCFAPIPLIAGITSNASTCDGTHVADTFCGGVNNPGPNTVFRFTVGPPLTGQLTLAAQSAGFTPVMYLMDGAEPCDSAPCFSVGDTFTPIPFDGLNPGEYWLVVAAEPNAEPGTCGEFALSNNASVVNSIFTDGFESSTQKERKS